MAAAHVLERGTRKKEWQEEERLKLGKERHDRKKAWSIYIISDRFRLIQIIFFGDIFLLTLDFDGQCVLSHVWLWWIVIGEICYGVFL